MLVAVLVALVVGPFVARTSPPLIAPDAPRGVPQFEWDPTVPKVPSSQMLGAVM